MASIRRNASGQREESVVKYDGDFADASPSPKLVHSRVYLTFRGVLSSLNLMDFVFLLTKPSDVLLDAVSYRHSRTSKRVPRSRGLNWRRAISRLFLFFMIGTFVGFMPFFTIDVLIDSGPYRRNLSFDSELPVDVSTRGSKRLQEIPVTDQLHDKEQPLPTPKWKVEDDPRYAAYGGLPNDVPNVVVRKLLIIVTITSAHPFQAHNLNRLAHALKDVPPPVLWIVVERPWQSADTMKILRASGIMFRHLHCDRNTTNVRKLAVYQRNIALVHIKKYRFDGIVHFADEDRLYYSELFEEMRKIRRLGTWPVATLTEPHKDVVLEGPLCNGSRVTGWHMNHRTKLTRRFYVNISGFAFNSTIIWDPRRWRRPIAGSVLLHSSGKDGLQESRFVQLLVEDERQMQGLGDSCTRIMVWQFTAEPPRFGYPSEWVMQNNLVAVEPVS